MQKIVSGATLSHMDITNEWTTKNEIGSVIEKQSYIANGIEYKVDGVFVLLESSATERGIANVLSEQYGKMVELVPKVDYPPGIQTPDYLIDGKQYDLKSPTGTSKNLLYNMVAKKKKQASNFIFDITGCPLLLDEINRQISMLYLSRHTHFIDEIVVMKNEKVIKVYKR